jgi:hypothetical protein
MMWMIVCGAFTATAAVMMASWDEAKVRPHPWLLEPKKVPARAIERTRIERPRLSR